jgi:alpha-beta hydrolase superfamily lysophospholipase
MQNVTINNNYQEKLAAYLFEPPENGQYMLVVCHGFRGTKENGGKIYAFAKKLQQLGIGTLAFDFSGSGSSEGDFSKLTLSRQADDLKKVLDYVDSNFSLPIILLGRSFGGSTVLAGGSKDQRVAGYILWSAPVQLEQTFSKYIPEEFNPIKRGESAEIGSEIGEYILCPDLISDFSHHDIDSCLQGIQARPVLVVHAKDDEVVDPSNAYYIKARVNNCSLFMVDNAGHRFLNKYALREGITIDWLKEKYGL